MAYMPATTRKDDGDKKTLTSDDRVFRLSEQILTVLKKIEYHLSLATDTELKDQDV